MNIALAEQTVVGGENPISGRGSDSGFWSRKVEKVPSGKWLELVWRILREHEGIVSGCKVNRLIAGLYGERLPAIDLSHVDLTGSEQRPEQHGGSVCRR